MVPDIPTSLNLYGTQRTIIGKKVLILPQQTRVLGTRAGFAGKTSRIFTNSINIMKRLTAALMLSLAVFTATAQSKKVEYKFTEASDLTMVGKLMPDTPNPYHRVDTVKFKGFTKSENKQVRMSAGLSVAFKTDSKTITIKTKYEDRSFPVNTGGLSARGYDLYIRKDGKWLWAASAVAKDNKPDDNVAIIKDMDGTMHECLLYLPVFSEESSIKIGVEKNATIEAIDNPFRHRIGIFGSSFTHGTSTSRAGMSYPDQLSRMTGLQFLSLGCSGNSKLQTYFADVLCAADVDALVFDGFSNPEAPMIKERLFPFIERIQKAHPDIPLIFQRTIRREYRNFNTDRDNNERVKTAMADSLMDIAVKKYKNVYYIKTTCATSEDHEATVDGVHPSDYGYTLWAKSIEKPIKKILKKYSVIKQIL